MRKSATLDPARLTFLADENGIRAGRLCLTALYPSRTRKGLRHRITVRHDGSFVDCSCDGYRGKHAHCFHQEAAPEIAREFRRRELRALVDVDLLREDNFLAHCPAGSLDEAQRLLWDAVGDVVAERYAARQGRVLTTEEVA